jgi:hypothetical protein
MTVFSNFGKYGIVGAGGGGLGYSYLATAFATTTNATLSGSNRIATLGSAGSFAYSNQFTLSGLLYIELEVVTTADRFIAGFSKFTGTVYSNNYWGPYNNVAGAGENVILSYGPAGSTGTGGMAVGSDILDAGGSKVPYLANGHIISWAIDVDAGKMWIGVNGVWHNGGGPAADSSPLTTGITSGNVTDLRFRWSNHSATPGGAGKILTEAESNYFNGGALF